MTDRLDSFVGQILGINSRYISIFGTGLPGMTAMTPDGQATPATDVVLNLKRSASDFANAYSGHDAPAIQALGNELTGDIMMLQTLAVIDDKTAAILLADIQTMMEEKE